MSNIDTKKLKKLIKKQGTQKEFAKKIDVNHNTLVSFINRGSGGGELLLKILTGLNIHHDKITYSE